MKCNLPEWKLVLYFTCNASIEETYLGNQLSDIENITKEFIARTKATKEFAQLEIDRVDVVINTKELQYFRKG